MKSDEPGFVSQLPGLNLDARSYTASGSAPSRTPAPNAPVPDGVSGIPGTGTVMPLAAQAGPGEGTSTEMPGQTSGSVIMAESDETANGLAVRGETQGFTNTGAGEGHADAWERYDWQQAPGGAA
jgi:hypothetical protein